MSYKDLFNGKGGKDDFNPSDIIGDNNTDSEDEILNRFKKKENNVNDKVNI